MDKLVAGRGELVVEASGRGDMPLSWAAEAG